MKNCPACVFGEYRMSFGKYKGLKILDLPLDYLNFLTRDGFAFVIFQEQWHRKNHEPEFEPNARFKAWFESGLELGGGKPR